jgi:PAS domain S-box-containing protein
MNEKSGDLWIFTRYGLALGSTALAALASWLLPAALTPAPYLAFYPAVVVSAALGGLGPGLTATFVSLFLVNSVFGHFDITNFGVLTRHIVWVTASVGVSILAETQRKAWLRELRNIEESRRLKDGLETSVVERTAELRDANRKLRAANEKLAEFDQAKTAFFSNISHEFRTPLALMLGPLDDALRDEDETLSEQNRRRFEMARRNGLRLQKLVNALLDFSRIEAGRAEASFAPTDLARATTEIASHFSSLCESAGLRLIVDCPPLDRPVYVDRDMWEKIVLNLLSNAFKFTLQGEISVRLRATGDFAELTVGDTGSGIPEAELPRLFERFHTIAGANGRSYEGSGIGLALTRELSHLHGGTIAATSVLGSGSTFLVRIPFGDAHLAPEQVRAAPASYDSSARAAAYVGEALLWLPDKDRDARQPSLDGQGEQPLVVLAEDSADMRVYLTGLLEKAGYRVQAFADGEAAFAACVEAAPKLVLSDSMMPNVSGLDLTRRLRADGRTAAIPVLLLSARAGEAARIEGYYAGADEYIEKPFGARELVARIDAAIRLARARTDMARHEGKISVLNRLASVVETAMDAIISVDIHQNVTLFNAAAERMFSCSAKDAVGRPLNDFIPERFRAAHANHVRSFAETGVSGRAMGRLGDLRALRSDGAEFPIEASIAQARVDGEKIFTVIVRDISARIAAAETERLLLGELDHRVKNTLATVHAIAAQTLKSTTDPAAFVTSFNGRLRALASAHNLLMRTSWQRAPLDALIHDQLMLGPDGSDDRIAYHGPPVMLAPQSALHLGLILHELGTNARKHGALSTAQGRLSVVWRTPETRPDHVEIAWAESGGPPVTPPSRRGFGSRLIERSLAHALKGRVKVDYAADGLKCGISLPVNP